MKLGVFLDLKGERNIPVFLLTKIQIAEILD